MENKGREIKRTQSSDSLIYLLTQVARSWQADKITTSCETNENSIWTKEKHDTPRQGVEIKKHTKKTKRNTKAIICETQRRGEQKKKIK